MKIKQKYIDFTGERIIPELENYFFYEHLARYKLVKNYVDIDDNILDVGCGDGYGTFYLSEYVRRAVGLDISVEAISLALKKYKRSNIYFYVTEPEVWPFSEEEFDIATCFEVFEHITTPEDMLKQIRKSLKKGGLLIISTPNKEVFGDNLKIPFHVKEYSLQEFLAILGGCFSIKEVLGQRHRKLLIKRWNFWISGQAMRFPFLLRLLNWYISKKPKKYLEAGYLEKLISKDNYFSKDEPETADYFIVICQKSV